MDTYGMINGDMYCKHIEALTSNMPLENIIHVAKNGSDINSGTVGDPFLTISGAYNHAVSLLNPVTDWDEAVVIKVAPGRYTEHLTEGHRRVYIVGGTMDFEHWPHDVIIYNTGVDEAHYPFAMDEGLNLIGLSVQVDNGEVFGKLVNRCTCSVVSFEGGEWIENTELHGLSNYFNHCTFQGNAFNLTGSLPAGGARFIGLRNCDIWGGTETIFGSTRFNASTIKLEKTKVANNCKIEGNWNTIIIGSEMYGSKKITFDTGGYIDIYNTVLNRIHFTSDTSNYKKIINCYFKNIPTDQCDVTADVDIVGVEYIGNYQDNGLCGKIKISSIEKNIGGDKADSYYNIEEAIEASSSGDIINLGAGTFTENIILPDGVNLKGKSFSDTILTSTSGVTLTISGTDTSAVSYLTVSSTSSGINNVRALEIQKGHHLFKSCTVASTTTEIYGDVVRVISGKFEARDLNINYTNEVSGGGDHKVINMLGGAICLRDSCLKVDIADASDDCCVLDDVTSGTIDLLKNVVTVNTVSSGITSFIKQDLNENKNDILYNLVELSGTQGTGVCYLIADDSGDLDSVSNTIKITGFNKNYLGSIGNNTVLKSHFDNVIAVDSVIGDGTYAFVNSPDPGDLRISGAYINMYDNDIVVAKRGGEFTSLKAALESITDNSSINRYNIHVHSGFYEEENPIELKPYVYIYGQFKHNPRIIAKNQLEHLFVLPTGYCTCDLGELTLDTPAGDSSHDVYAVYAGPGCKPIMGIYQCLFLGDNSNYCNGFYCEEPLSGYHMVNCMTYGAFNIFAHMSGGNWTDSGFIPEGTTAMKYYLYMDGGGVALVDLMRAKCPNFEKLFYINHAGAELVVSDIYAEDQCTLTTGPDGGKIRMRGSTFHGKNILNAGDITIHGGTFEDNANLEALTGNLGSLSITSTSNKNENTHCVKITGGGSTEVYLGGGNIFDSPNGIQPIQLDGTFSDVQVEGVRQYNLSTLASGGTHTFEHLPDLEYSRIVQVQAYTSVAVGDSINYLTAEESNYIQEDDTKTSFVEDTVTLSGVGSVAYGHWHLNNIGTTTTAVDSSGNGRDGTIYNMEPADWATGKVGAHCLRFNASDEHVRCGNIASFDYNDSFSLDFWYNTSNTASQYAVSKMSYMMGIYPNPSYYKGYGAYLSAHRMHFMLSSNDTNNLIHVYTTDDFTSGAWHHCVVTYDGSATASGVHIWIDNQDKDLTGVADSLTAATTCASEFQISGRNRTNTVWDGSLDEVVVYEQELTSTEVAYRYNNNAGIESLLGTYPTASGYYVTTASGSQLDISTWTNIGGILFDETIKSNTQIRYLLSVDNRSSWSYWSGSAWLAGTLSGIDTCGNSSDVLEALDSNSFNGLYTVSSGTLDVAASLKTTEQHVAPVLKKVDVNYSTASSRDRVGDSSMKITYVDTTHTKITNITDQPITGIKCNILKVKPY